MEDHGGGSINIFTEEMNNLGNISANGGLSGGIGYSLTGGAGGDGSVSIEIMNNGKVVK
ncbi:hypothetical protein D3C72_1346320 [compost metagenome]